MIANVETSQIVADDAAPDEISLQRVVIGTPTAPNPVATVLPKKRDEGREHRLEAKAYQYGGRDGHGRTESRHTLKQTSESPDHHKDKNAPVVGEGSELAFDYLNGL